MFDVADNVNIKYDNFTFNNKSLVYETGLLFMN